MRLEVLMAEARACTICAAHLPLGPRPLLQGSRTSRVLVVGQAPGKAAHESGTPWDDRSGDRLRSWLDVPRETFYDAGAVALLPMGFCDPGTGPQGDLRPRPECAPAWHERLTDALVGVRLTILAGAYAYQHALGNRYRTLTDAVQAYETLLPDRIALPHPSPRNNRWLARHPWFEADVLPALRARVREVLARG